MQRPLKVTPVKSRKPQLRLGFADFMRGIIAAVIVEQHRQRKLDVGFIPLAPFCAVLHDWRKEHRDSPSCSKRWTFPVVRLTVATRENSTLRSLVFTCLHPP